MHTYMRSCYGSESIDRHAAVAYVDFAADPVHTFQLQHVLQLAHHNHHSQSAVVYLSRDT